MAKKTVKLSTIKVHDKNPRTITEQEFEQLKSDIKSFGKMMAIRPIVVDADWGNRIIGGTMRYRACLALGMKEVPADWIRFEKGLTKAQREEFIIKDNTHRGRWDWDLLANEWPEKQVIEWGVPVDIKFDGDINELFTEADGDTTKQTRKCPHCGKEL